MKKINNDKDYLKLNVAIEYRGNSHLLLIKCGCYGWWVWLVLS